MFSELTKGGQTIFQAARMFFAIFWKLVGLFIFIFFIAFISLIYLQQSKYEQYETIEFVKTAPFYYLFNKIESSLNSIGLKSNTDPQNSMKQTFIDSSGYKSKLMDSQIVKQLAQSGFIKSFDHEAVISLLESILISILLTFILGFALVKYGHKLSSHKTLRGALSCTPEELNLLVKDASNVSPIKIAGLSLPEASETKHCLINGSVGSGKTVCLTEIMAQVRQQNKKAIVYDKMGVHTARFYRPGKDIILNPFDKRSPLWLLSSEIRNDADFKSLASSLIPESKGSGQDPFWNMAARELLAATAKHLYKQGIKDNQSILKYVLGSDLTLIKDLLQDTVVGALVSDHSDKTTTSIKSILTAYISGLEYLPTEGEPFSIRDWITDEQDDSWLFITSRSDMHQAVKPLISTWLDIATNAVLSLPRSRERRIYEFLDELPSLQCLPSLPTCMSEGRQFGLCVYITIQSLSQIYKHYGEHSANEVMDLCNTLVALRAPDRKTANMISDMLNEGEVEEYKESLSYGVRDNRDGVSINKNVHMRKIALPSEIQNLNDLEAYVRIPGNFPITKVKFDYTNYDEINEPIILREEWQIQSHYSSETDENEDINDSFTDINKVKNNEHKIHKISAKNVKKPLINDLIIDDSDNIPLDEEDALCRF